METIKIEKNMAKPAIVRRSKYPFQSMEIGDSFATPNRSAISSAYIYGKRKSKKFIMRSSKTEDDKIEYRIWRTE